MQAFFAGTTGSGNSYVKQEEDRSRSSFWLEGDEQPHDP